MNRTNTYREQHGVAPLTWNRTLAKQSKAWVEGCVFDHENQTDVGENLYAAYGDLTTLSPSFIMKQAVDTWHDEHVNFEWDDPENPVNFENAGHFTQLVWKDSVSIGCGFKDCADFDFVACRYWPPGNVMGEVTANVPPEVALPPAANAA